MAALRRRNAVHPATLTALHTHGSWLFAASAVAASATRRDSSGDCIGRSIPPRSLTTSIVRCASLLQGRLTQGKFLLPAAEAIQSKWRRPFDKNSHISCLQLPLKTHDRANQLAQPA
jgi:hypothetical protein